MAGSYAGASGFGGGVAGVAGSFDPGPAGQGVAGVAGSFDPGPAGQGVAGMTVAGQGGAGGVAAAAGAGAGGVAGVAGVGGVGGVADVAGVGGGGGAGGGIAPDHCMAGITNYDSAGPFTFQSARSGSINILAPDVPAGCRVPMVHLANGTGANCATYRASLERLASHGFMALCYESTQTGAGTQGIEAFEAALAQYPDLVDLKFGSTGHSQGGQSSFVVLQFAEEKWGDQGVYAGLVMQPASGFGAQPSTGTWQQVYGKIKSPMFMFSGAGTDGLVSQSWVQQGFDALSGTVEAYHWAKTGGSHIPVPNGEEQQISIPWFRWKLLGDQQACEAFKAIRNDPTWTEAAVQNEQPCM